MRRVSCLIFNEALMPPGYKPLGLLKVSNAKSPRRRNGGIVRRTRGWWFVGGKNPRVKYYLLLIDIYGDNWTCGPSQPERVVHLPYRRKENQVSRSGVAEFNLWLNDRE
jgi:hypothetical protein